MYNIFNVEFGNRICALARFLVCPPNTQLFSCCFESSLVIPPFSVRLYPLFIPTCYHSQVPTRPEMVISDYYVLSKKLAPEAKETTEVQNETQ